MFPNFSRSFTCYTSGKIKNIQFFRRFIFRPGVRKLAERRCTFFSYEGFVTTIHIRRLFPIFVEGILKRGVIISQPSFSQKKNSFLLLFGLGISTLGDFIYLVAINVLVLKLTGSAAAVAGLWIIGPIASMVTKFWSGSMIDRLNIRRIMIGTDLIRAVLVAIIPFFNLI